MNRDVLREKLIENITTCQIKSSYDAESHSVTVIADDLVDGILDTVVEVIENERVQPRPVSGRKPRKINIAEKLKHAFHAGWVEGELLGVSGEHWAPYFDRYMETLRNKESNGD